LTELPESGRREQVAQSNWSKEIVMPPAKKAATTTKAAAAAKVPASAQKAASAKKAADLPKKTAEAVLGDLVALTIRHLKEGDKIRLTGLGILQVQARQARTGRNPATGAAIEIAASKKIAFRPSKELKEAV
jgi:DNA-binding protein HU-beta